MASSKDSFTYLDPCIDPSILMGDDTLVQVCGKGRIDLEHGNFQHVSHVTSLSINILSIYHITHLGTGK